MKTQDLIDAEDVFDGIIKYFIDTNVNNQTGIFALALGLGHTAAIYNLDFEVLVGIARVAYEADVERAKAKNEANK